MELKRIYTFDLDSDGEPLNYTELKMIVWCQPGTSISSSIYLNSGLSAYITQNNLPYSSALVHSFHFNSIFENCYRASGVSGGLLTTQESKIINNSGSPLSVFNYIRLANTTYNYPLNTIIKIWGNNMNEWKNGTERYLSTKDRDILLNSLSQSTPVAQQLDLYKQKLLETDYISCKIIEGESTKEQYSELIKQRSEWRKNYSRFRTIIIRVKKESIVFNFDTEVCFGTAGVRGLIGKDINIPIVKRITQGLSNYIKKQNITQPKVVIGYDCRRMSKEFAEAVALILNANGIATYSFNKVTPAPMISFAVRALMCISGIMITASHNSKEYNGYKIYWQDGGQIISPIDKEIEYEINKIKDSSMILTTHRQWSIDSNLYYLLNDKIDEVYVNELCKSILQPEIIKEMQEEIRVVYTPLHGTGAELIDKTLSHLGIMNLFFVEQQLNPNGKFPTIPNPNPEDPKAFILGLQLAKKVKADIIIANDPDADRIGLYVKHKNDYIRFTGDMIGALLLEYQLSIKQELKNSSKKRNYN